MASPCPTLRNGSRLVVGSLANEKDLQSCRPEGLGDTCDIVEVRLDLLAGQHGRPWAHLGAIPLLFTARRPEEGGGGNLDAGQRSKLLQAVLDDASLIDIEVASIPEMAPFLAEIGERQLPWVASFHDFNRLPDAKVLAEAASKARDAGAHVFKVAARLADPSSLASLTEFQLADHGIAVATMGMGPLGPVSRLLCAQAGSVLNYGFLGNTPTAPGQWSAGQLKQALRDLENLGKD